MEKTYKSGQTKGSCTHPTKMGQGARKELTQIPQMNEEMNNKEAVQPIKDKDQGEESAKGLERKHIISQQTPERHSA